MSYFHGNSLFEKTLFEGVFANESFEMIFVRSVPSGKVGCVFPMVVVSILSHAEFGLDGHREDAPHLMFEQSLPVQLYRF